MRLMEDNTCDNIDSSILDIIQPSVISEVQVAGIDNVCLPEVGIVNVCLPKVELWSSLIDTIMPKNLRNGLG